MDWSIETPPCLVWVIFLARVPVLRFLLKTGGCPAGSRNSDMSMSTDPGSAILVGTTAWVLILARRCYARQNWRRDRRRLLILGPAGVRRFPRCKRIHLISKAQTHNKFARTENIQCQAAVCAKALVDDDVHGPLLNSHNRYYFQQILRRRFVRGTLRLPVYFSPRPRKAAPEGISPRSTSTPAQDTS